jgi:hypothetical protein
MACTHQNTHQNPAIILETVYTEGRRMIAKRQCAVCCTAEEVVRSPPPNLAQEGVGIDVFYDWDQRTWQPMSERVAYEASQLARIAPPEETEEPTELE